MVTITFKFTAIPESPSSFLPKSPSSLLPPFETVIHGRWGIAWSMSSVRAHVKLLMLTPQVYCSSLLLKFTCRFYPPTNQAQIYGIPLQQRSFTYTRMHVYFGQMYPPLQLTIDVWNTITPNKFHIVKNAHICMTDRPLCNWPYIHATPLHPISFTYRRM